MINYKELYKTAPQAPSYDALWAPVYFEPMMGSGEKFTVIVAAFGFDGKSRVCQAIRPHVVKAMYGNKHNNFNSLIAIIIESLEIHISKHHGFNGWVSPISGAELGEINQAQSTDITGVLRQAVQLTASLSSLDFFSSEDEETDDKYSSENTWSNQLKNQILSSHANYERFFNRTFKVSGESRPSKIFFLSDKSAFNTERLIPTHLSTHLDRNKARILDLLAVRKHDIFERNVCEFIVYRPPKDDVTYSKRQFSKLDEALSEIYEIGDKYSIRVVPVTTVYQASRRIIKAEEMVA